MAAIAGVAALIAATSPSAAQDNYPTRPVRLVVGFGAGGPTDIPARFIADKLGTLLGQRVIVENKMGAAGMLATRDVLAQPADGYNLLLCTHFEAINTALYKSPGFKLTELAPVSLIAKYYYGLALANVIPADTIEELMSYAKARPGEVSYATLGPGSAQEIMARQFEKQGWSWAVWQFADNFAVFDLATQKWVEPIRDALIPLRETQQKRL